MAVADCAGTDAVRINAAGHQRGCNGDHGIGSTIGSINEIVTSIASAIEYSPDPCDDFHSLSSCWLSP